MREIKFRPIMYSKSLDKYFIGEGLSVDSGLSCLFGFENEGLGKLEDVVLCSKKFIDQIDEEWWELDWVHIGNLEYTGISDIYEGDIIAIPYITPFGDITEEYDKHFIVEFKNGMFGYSTPTRFNPLEDFIIKERGEYISNQGNKTLYKNFIGKVIGNIYENPELKAKYES